MRTALLRRILFVLASIASALLAIEVSPPPSYVVDKFSLLPETSPGHRASIRPRWPGAFLRPQPSTERQPGATWSPSWRPPILSDYGRGK